MGKIAVYAIDCQNDFMGGNNGQPYQEHSSSGLIGSADLAVKGATRDMDQFVDLLDSKSTKITSVGVSLDSHATMDSGHAVFWEGPTTRGIPTKFTGINAKDIKDRVWVPGNLDHYYRMYDNAIRLEMLGLPKIKIWSELGHCRIGTWGHNIYRPLAQALDRWSVGSLTAVDYTFKGMNPFIEQFGIFEALIPQIDDPTTKKNTRLLDWFRDQEIIGVAGEAANVCVLHSMRQAAKYLPAKHVRKIHILFDCMSAVVGPGEDSDLAKQVALDEMRSFGMQIVKSTDFLT